MADSKASNPLRAVLAIRREELPLALLMFGYFFLVITTFWVLKPIKKALLVGFYENSAFELFGARLTGSQAELVAKVLNMVVAFLAVVAFTALSRRLQRQRLALAFSGFFLLCFGLYAVLVRGHSAAVVWSFYLFGDLYNTVMVATFFAFLNDSVAPSAARRVYGLVVLGGVVGGVFGTSALRTFISALDNSAWMLVCGALTAVIMVLAFAAGKFVDAGASGAAGAEPEQGSKPSDEAEEPGGNPALAGARLVFRSRYLLSVVAIVGLYEIVSTIMDFQFTATLEHYSKLGVIDFKKHIATVFLITNSVSLVVQFFATSIIMSRFKLTVALLIMPVAALTSSSLFMAVPALWFGSMLNTADNALNYSVNQSAKEALYTPTTRDEKYKAKAFIDMFVQRFAKALAVGVSLGITVAFKDFSTVRWLSLFTVAVVGVWVIAARYAGRHFHELTDSGERDG